MNSKNHHFRIWLALGLCAALTGGFFAACGTPASPGEKETTLVTPAEDTGLTLHVYQPHANQAALWDSLAADYKAITGVTVAVRTPSGANHELKDALKAESNAPGIFLFTNPRDYGDFKDHAHNLSDTQAYQHLLDDRLALRAENQVIGLPVGVEAYGIIYNKKILNQYFTLDNRTSGLKSMEEVKTYKDLEDLVKDLEAHKTSLGLDGVFAAPALKEGESTSWGTRLLSVPVGYEIEKSKMDVTGEDIKELRLRHESGYKSFIDLALNYATTKETLENRSYADAAGEFAAGKAAMVLGGTEFLGLLNSSPGQTVGAEDVVFLPALMTMEGVNNQGLAFETVEYAAINGRASEEEILAAGEFLNWLFTSEKGMDFLANRLNLIAPYDTVGAASLPQNPLSVNAFEWLKKEGVHSAVTWSSLVPHEDFRDKVVGRGLLSYARGESDWEKHREGLLRGWKENLR